MRLNNLFITIVLLGAPAIASAQEEAAPAAENAAPTTEAAPAVNGSKNNDNAKPSSPSDDPGDVIAAYFSTMGDIVAENMDVPSVLLEKFSAYMNENEKSMRNASKKFENKMNSLKTNESEAYRETVQRKITPQLNRLISLLLDFSDKYPAEAKKLDSMLKVDEKYTYQQ